MALIGFTTAVWLLILHAHFKQSTKLFDRWIDPSNCRNGHRYHYLYPAAFDIYLYKARHCDSFIVKQVQQQIEHVKHLREINEQ